MSTAPAHRLRRRGVAVLAGSVLAILAAGCGGSPAGPSGGRLGDVVPDGPSPTSVDVANVSADDGFRPSADGFSFANYGNEDMPQNLSATEVRGIFGDGVCANMSNGCELTPPAQAWMDSVNREMSGGHCFGFSVAALLFFKHTIEPSAFGASTANQLQIAGNTSLQSRIAESMAMQFLPAVQNAVVTGTPNDILAKLADALKPNPAETYTLGIAKRDGTGGHAVTPFALESRDNGHTVILIYDNNWPNTVREIDVDTNANTWHYQAAPNPNEPAAIYEGDATTKTLLLFPTSVGQGQQPCAFCSAAQPASLHVGRSPARLVPLDIGTSEELFIRSSDPSADQLDPASVFSADGTSPFVDPTFYQGHDYTFGGGTSYFLPPDQPYTITLDGSAAQAPVAESVDLLAHGTDVTIDGIGVQPGKKVVIQVSADGSAVTYTADDSSSPTFDLGDSGGRVDGGLSLTPQGLQEGDEVTLNLSPQSFAIDDSKLSHALDYAVSLRSVDQSGETMFSDHTVHVDAGVDGSVDWSGDTPESPDNTLNMTWSGGSETLNNGG